METLLALAPLLICPLVMLVMGGGIVRALERVAPGNLGDHQVPAPSPAGGQGDG